MALLQCSKIVLCIGLICLLATPGSTLECYVCRPGSALHRLPNDVEAKHFDGLATQTPFCNDYQTSKRVHFIQECPQDSAGCLTRIQGDSLLRTCARVALDECKVVGDISMCYCKQGLCNAPDGQLRAPAGLVEPEEGSGDFFYYEDDVDYWEPDQTEIEEEIRRFREQQLDFEFDEDDNKVVIDDNQDNEISAASHFKNIFITALLLPLILLLLGPIES